MTPNSSLLQWLATFQLDGVPAVELKNEAYYNLADGYVCARILNQISPLYFTDKWLDGIKPVAPDGSWRLRVSNLKRILQKIHDYASDLQSSQFMLGAINPDVTVIAQNFDPDQISRLIQLILFCAINCEKKQVFIEKIRDLPTQVKQNIKEAIEELLVKNNNDNQTAKLNTSQFSHNDSIPNLSSSSSNMLNSPARSRALRLGVKDSPQSGIGERNESSHLDLSSQSTRTDLDQNLELMSQNRRLQTEIKRLERELNRVETEREDYRLKSNLLSEDLDRITLKHEELKDKAEQAKRLQDELDEHKHISEKVISYETMVENLVKKNSDIKKELKSMEDKNLAYIQKIVRLEQENEQLENSVNQVDIYKRQLSEAQTRLTRETHRADKAEVDLARLSDKLESTKKENEKLFQTTNQLMRSTSNIQNKSDIHALNRPFETVDLKDGPTSTRRLEPIQQAGDDLDSMPTPVIELKERLARLEIENQLLEAQVNSKTEMNKSVLGGLLDEATEKCKRLEDENRQVRKKMLMLESNLRELTQGGQQPSTSGLNLAQDSSSDNTLALIKRVEDLQRSLYQREQELRDAEARYKKNISKARDVITALNNNQAVGGNVHPSCMSSVSFNSSSLDEANLLRQQLREREERIIDLEREFHEFKKLKEVHERLILSAFYGLTTPMQWKNAERRLEQTTLTSPALDRKSDQ